MDLCLGVLTGNRQRFGKDRSQLQTPFGRKTGMTLGEGNKSALLIET